LLPNSNRDIYSDLYFEVDPICHPKIPITPVHHSRAASPPSTRSLPRPPFLPQGAFLPHVCSVAICSWLLALCPGLARRRIGLEVIGFAILLPSSNLRGRADPPAPSVPPRPSLRSSVAAVVHSSFSYLRITAALPPCSAALRWPRGPPHPSVCSTGRGSSASSAARAEAEPAALTRIGLEPIVL
jgi:hypothetical protein